MSYLSAILWFCTFPLSIAVSYYLTVWFLKKTGKYHPEKNEE
jgi:hypothetical protein